MTHIARFNQPVKFHRAVETGDLSSSGVFELVMIRESGAALHCFAADVAKLKFDFIATFFVVLPNVMDSGENENEIKCILYSVVR